MLTFSVYTIVATLAIVALAIVTLGIFGAGISSGRTTGYMLARSLRPPVVITSERSLSQSEAAKIRERIEDSGFYGEVVVLDGGLQVAANAGPPIGGAGGRRLRVVEIASCFFDEFLRLGTRAADVVADPLPEDATLVAVAFDGRTIRLVYQSSSFDRVPDDAPLPYLAPMFRARRPTDVEPSTN